MLVVYRLENDPKQYEIEQRGNVENWMIQSYRELIKTLRKDINVEGFATVMYRYGNYPSLTGEMQLQWKIVLEESRNVEWLNLDKINPVG